MGDFAFDEDSRVVAAGSEGAFTADLTSRWNGTAGAVNGGYMLAICTRALALGIQLTVHLRAHPAPGWLACRATTRFVSNGYHEEDFEVWDSAGTLVAQSRQLALILPS